MSQENESKELKLLKKANVKQHQRIKDLCASLRKNVTCRVCLSIFVEPIILPCGNTICKSHYTGFNKRECAFCKHAHDLLLSGLVVNESFNKIIASDLYLNEEETKFKESFCKKLGKTTTLFKELKAKEADTEALCHNHFGALIENIEVQKEELKLRLDKFGEKLKEQVKECEAKCESRLTSFQKNILSGGGVLERIENEFAAEFRKGLWDKQRCEALALNLADMTQQFSQKLTAVDEAKYKIGQCKLKTRLDTTEQTFSGELTLLNDSLLIDKWNFSRDNHPF